MHARCFAKEHLGETDDHRCSLRFLRPILNEFCDAGISARDMKEIAKALAPRDHVDQIPQRGRGRESGDSGACGSTEHASNKLRKDDLHPNAKKIGRTAMTTAERLKQLQSLPPTQIVLEVLKAEDAHDNTKGRLKEATARVKTLEDQLEILAEQLETLSEEHQELLAATRFRKNEGSRSWVSVFGGYQLAVKKALGWASRQSTADLVAGEAHQGSVKDPRTVSRFEYRLSLAKALRSKDCLLYTSPSPRDRG